MANKLEGYADLSRKLADLATPKENLAALRAAVRTPMAKVMKKARANSKRFSPGRAASHKTYRGRIVTAGFASRNIRLVTVVSKDKSTVRALLGVRREAYYALMFFERGTAFIPKQPWLVPAFESSQDLMIRGIGEVMRARIEKIAKKRITA